MLEISGNWGLSSKAKKMDVTASPLDNDCQAFKPEIGVGLNCYC